MEVDLSTLQAHFVRGRNRTFTPAHRAGVKPGNRVNGLSVRRNRRGTDNEDLNEGSSRQTTIILFVRPGFFSGGFGKDTGTASIAA